AVTGTLAATGPTDIVKVVTNGNPGATLNLTAQPNQQVGALLIANTLSTVQATQLNSNGTFTVNSGAYLTVSNGIASTVNITATPPNATVNPIVLPVETIFFANSTTNTNFTGPLAGGGSLVLGGNNAIFLGNGIVNTYTGGT